MLVGCRWEGFDRRVVVREKVESQPKFLAETGASYSGLAVVMIVLPRLTGTCADQRDRRY